MMRRKVRYGRHQCRGCGAWVTNNALGRSRHSCEAYREKLRKEQAERERKRITVRYPLPISGDEP